ncbi:MAG: RNHCP domain-containing protein [Phycisphaeraceae bacterium]|nr:RNHCP domain-containing protein [Phycisphaeraceae bacterium]
MSRDHRSAGFTCINCRGAVSDARFGTRHRNHCPRCLWSRHLDESPGDRLSACRAPMRPVGIEVRDGGEWAIIHRCTSCGALRANRIAGDDHELSLLALALRPLSNPAFPLDVIAPG